MSIRAEFVRLGLRWFLKPTSRPGVTITRRREQIGNFQRWVPAPPNDAEIARGALGGIPALFVAMPNSRPDRHILFLHGGGYVTGAPDLYVHMLWRIAAAAAAQSGRTICPRIDEVTDFSAIAQQAARHDRSLLFCERRGTALEPLEERNVQSVVVATGPEGGFTEAEAAQAEATGFTIATLGPRILRAETAAVAVVALAQHRWGDLGRGGTG
jgi:hypothetical protein